jgi:hypothetical protein
VKFSPRVPRLGAISALAIAVLANDALPTEFRLFVTGWNDTEQGRFLFDANAAAATMAAYKEWGVDLMIDLEHQSLTPGTPADPTARDARGWCQLELRPDGSLWAVNVSWTPDGAARLREKRQRYISPAFGFNRETSRVTKILNVAITAMPATHETPALVAAHAIRRLAAGPSLDDRHRALSEALRERFPPQAGADACAPCGPWVVDVFDASVVYENEGKLFEVSYTFDGSVATLGPTAAEVKRTYAPLTPAPAPPPPPPAATTAANTNRPPTARLAVSGGRMDPKIIKEALDALIAGDSEKCMEILKGAIAAAAGAPPDAPKTPEAGTETPAVVEDDEEKKKEPMVAAARLAIALTGKTDPGEAMAELSRRSKIAIELEEREATLAKDRATLEAGERRRLVGDLVKLGVEIPATAWSDDKGTIPCERLSKEPIEELRARVQKLSAARGRPRLEPLPPTGGGDGAKEFKTPDGIVTLSVSELSECERAGAKPEAYAALKAKRQKKKPAA